MSAWSGLEGSPVAPSGPVAVEDLIARERAVGWGAALQKMKLRAQLVGSAPRITSLGGEYTARAIIQHIDNLIAEQSHG